MWRFAIDKQAVVTPLPPIPPGVLSGLPKLGTWRREFGDTILIWSPGAGKHLAASLNDFDDPPDETEIS